MGGPNESAKLEFDPPAEWKKTTPTSSFRKAQFMLPRAEGDAEDGEMVVFYFGRGEGGTVEANMERWRGMFTAADGKPLPASAGRRESFESNGLKTTLLEVSGSYSSGMFPGAPAGPPKENYVMLAAVVETTEGPWFFKGTGPRATMERHRESVMALLRSVRREQAR